MLNDMVTFIASLLVVAAFAVIVYLLALRFDTRVVGLLERYRPHAPMADWSLSLRDEQRQYSDLVAVAAHRGLAPFPARRRRRAFR